MKATLKKTALILLGNLGFALGAAYFLVPSGMVSGGATGLALALNALFSIPTVIGLWVLNVAFFLAGALVMGKSFALTTLLSSFAYPLFFSLTSKLVEITGPLTDDPFLCMMFCGVSFGVGIGVILRQGASTGGTDIPALILNQKLGVPVSGALMAIDVVAIVVQALRAEKEQVLYGMIFLLLYTLVLDYVLTQGKSRIQIQIISKSCDAINQLLISRFDKGSTLYRIQGGYSREDMFAVSTVVDRRSLFRLREEVLAIDPQAFIVISQVSEVNGRGFTISRL